MSDRWAANTSQTGVEPLFYEKGASWYWVLAGPLSALVMLWVEIDAGIGPQLVTPACFLVLVGGFFALQVKAARIHTSVELTADTLREGTEELAIDEIERVIPEPPQAVARDRKSWQWALKWPSGRVMEELAPEPPRWQSSRSLGEVSGVPRGRIGIGLNLKGDRTVQAWARRHGELRQLLTELVEQRRSSPPST